MLLSCKIYTDLYLSMTHPIIASHVGELNPRIYLRFLPVYSGVYIFMRFPVNSLTVAL